MAARRAEVPATGRVTRAGRKKAVDSADAEDDLGARAATKLDAQLEKPAARAPKRAKKAAAEGPADTRASAAPAAEDRPEPAKEPLAAEPKPKRKARAKAAPSALAAEPPAEAEAEPKPKRKARGAAKEAAAAEPESPKVGSSATNRKQRGIGEAVPVGLSDAEDEEGVVTVSEPAAAKGKSKGPVSNGATRHMETALWAQGYEHVVGIDEAGRGPLAGPVVAAACCLPANVTIPGVADSKQLDEQQRDELYDVIVNTPGVVWAVAHIDHTTIDRINILQATMQAMTDAASQLPTDKRDYLLVDGNRLPKELPAPARAVVQGDSKVYCIAAASILAKVTRDRMMLQYHEQYPQYNFAQHKGYAVPAHYTALRAHGPCDIHRRSFQPIRGMTGWTREGQLEEEAKALAQQTEQQPEKKKTGKRTAKAE